MTGGHSSTATITLSAPAPSSLTIKFKSSNTAVVPTPASIVIPAGQTQGTVKLTTKAVTTSTPVDIEAYADGAGHLDRTLTVTP